MLTYREAATALIDLQIPSDSPVIVHASLSAFDEVRGGAETFLGASECHVKTDPHACLYLQDYDHSA